MPGRLHLSADRRHDGGHDVRFQGAGAGQEAGRRSGAVTRDVRGRGERRAAGRPAEVTVAIHTCRGNFKSTWMASGGYDPVAETVFTRLNVKAFFLEYDTDRAGGFEPLRFVPKGKKVVLGLISSKVPELEKKDDLKRRIDAASRYVPLENLCSQPAVRLLQHAPRQQDHGRRPEAEARPRARGRPRRLGRGLAASPSASTLRAPTSWLLDDLVRARLERVRNASAKGLGGTDDGMRN